MVTGRRAFQGKSYTSLVGAILSTDPPPLIVKPFTPPALERLVRRCLAKEADDRYQSMRDVVLDLQLPQQETAAPAKSQRWPWAVAGACVLAALAGWGAWMGRAPGPSLPVALTMEPPEGSRFASVTNAGGSAISPDGRTLAFTATSAKGGSLLYVRLLDSLAARPLPGTEEAARPFWSPDSKSLAFVAGGKLKRMEVAGGVPITLCEANSGRGGTWNEDGVILFSDQGMGVHRIPASGGTPSPVTQLNREAGELAHYYPQFLPGGRRFLYLVRHGSAEKIGIRVASLDAKPGAPSPQIVQTQYKAEYDPGSGRLLYILGEGMLMAQKLELDPPRLTGDPVTVAEVVRVSGANGYAEFSVSGNSTMFHGQGSAAAPVQFSWRDRTGKLLETIRQPVQAIFSMSLSPNGNRVAFTPTSNEGTLDVWVMDLARGLSTRITFSRAAWPRWSPDAKYLYYVNDNGISRKAADGSGEEELVLKTGRLNSPVNSLSPDGKYLLYGVGDIMTLPLTVERKPEAYVQTKYNELGASFSPDGRWVAYHSDESGKREVYVQGFPERRGKWLVSVGSKPEWRGDGKELYWARPTTP